MDFSGNQMGMENLFQNGFNAVSFSLVGMVIVFGGLTIISIYIAVLPKILAWATKHKKTTIRLKKATAEETGIQADTELLLVIAMALHLEQTRAGDSQRITWPRHEQGQTAWQAAGRIRGLAKRSHLGRRPGE